jgi:hypothetical protein
MLPQRDLKVCGGVGCNSYTELLLWLYWFVVAAGPGVQNIYILNIWDIRQLSLRLDNLRLKEQQNAGPKAQPAK